MLINLLFSLGFNGLKAADEVPKGALTRADVSHLPRLQTPVSTALEQLIVSLCVEEGWETSSPEASPTRQNGGASGRSSPFQLADSADSQGSVQNGTGKATRNRSKPARVRFREDREGSGEGSSEGGEGKLESGRAEHVHASLRKGEDGNGAGSASESNDEFEKMALRFHKQPVKVGHLRFLAMFLPFEEHSKTNDWIRSLRGDQ